MQLLLNSFTHENIDFQRCVNDIGKKTDSACDLPFWKKEGKSV